MTQAVPHRVTVDSHKLAELVFDKIFPAIHGEPERELVLALICAAALVMRPHLEMTKLKEAILQTSSYLSTFLAEPEHGEAN